MMWCLFFIGQSSAFKTDLESVKMLPKASVVKIEVPAARFHASSVSQEGRTAA